MDTESNLQKVQKLEELIGREKLVEAASFAASDEPILGRAVCARFVTHPLAVLVAVHRNAKANGNEEMRQRAAALMRMLIRRNKANPHDLCSKGSQVSVVRSCADEELRRVMEQARIGALAAKHSARDRARNLRIKTEVVVHGR